MRRTYKYAAMTEDAAPVCVQGTGRERRRWTFYEAVKFKLALSLIISYKKDGEKDLFCLKNLNNTTEIY